MSRSAFCYQLLFGTLVVVLASALNAETLKDINIINEANETTTLSGEITTLNFNIDAFTNSDESTDRSDVLDTTKSDQNGDESNLNVSTVKNIDKYHTFLNEDNSKNQRQNDSSTNPEGNEVENEAALTQLGNANSNIGFIKKDDTKTVKNNTKESSASGTNSRARSIHELSKMFGFENENVPPEYITILEKMKPEERLTSTLAFKKRYIEAHFDPVTYFNRTGPPLETETPENYGISIVLSSDIVALTSVVEAMEDSLCKNQSLRLLRGLLTGKLWALKMYDASAKSPTGLLWGNTFQLGNFDECLQARSNDNEQEVIRGQYCLANVELTKKTFPTIHYGKRTGPREDIHWAVCVPASCTASQIQQFVSKLLISSPGGGKITLEPNQCHKEDTLKLQKKDVIFGSFMLGFSGILVACTIFHIYIKLKNKNQPKKTPGVLVAAILSFSIARNMRKIFSVKKNEHGLDAIAGIRTLSMFLILTGHALIFIFSGPVMNSGFYDDMLKRVENTLLLSNPLLVDTFLLISAFLFCRLLLVEFDKRKGHVNVIPIYLFRYLRVTPSYFVVISLYMTWLDKLGSGPLWDAKMQVEKERCLESWWTNILYINNYVNTENLCMFQSWYLSVDTQLFFLAPAIIYPLWRWQRVGEWILGVVTCVATLIPFVVTYWQELDPTLLPFPKEVVDIASNYYFKEAYIKTHMRASAYFIGLLSGYILHKIQTNGIKLKTKQLVAGWTLAIICGASSVFTVSVFFQPYYTYNPLYSATYSALHRVAWAASTGWLLIVCSTKNGGPLGRIFLWKPLIPLGRLTFCAYLVNGLVELHSLGTLRDSIHLSIFGLTVLCFSHILQTFVGALVLCVMFESPIHGFERILLKALGNHQRRTPRDEIKQDLESTRK